MRVVAVAGIAVLATTAVSSSVAYANPSSAHPPSVTAEAGGTVIHFPPTALIGGTPIEPDGPGNGGSAGSNPNPP